MDTTRIEEMLQKLPEIILSLDKDIAELKISSAALTAVVASQLTPDDPSVGEEHIRLLEAEGRRADPNAKQRQEIADVIDALKLMRKHGGSFHS